jgi:hypothetical protein
MTEPRSNPIRLRVWILLGLTVIGLGILGVIHSRPDPVERVLILASPLDCQGRDVGPGMEILISDLLEVLTGATVTHAPSLPLTADLKRLPPQMRVLRFQGGREADRLAFIQEWTTVSRLLSGQPWILDAPAPQRPGKAMEHVIQQWPLAVQYHQLDQLIPRSPTNFWLLLEDLAIQDDQTAAEHLAASQKLTEIEPGCATVWTTLGDHLYRSLWVNPEQAGIGLNSRTHHAFQKAVNLVPGHPRATFVWSMMLTDTGNQSLALQVLKEATRLRPAMPDLYLGIAYASRTSGLLEGARRALVRRSDLLGPMASPSTWFAETTYLYLGDLAAFGQELTRAGSLRQDASILFYNGYFALLKGDRPKALGFMKSGSDPRMNPTPFRDLCRVYLAYLEGRPKAGLAELREIDEVRGKLRIPDGEWTFKEAEAYSLLGDPDRGIDCATRAFVQGFSCAAWYENSPFLARVREHPRWPTLRRNIRERQAVLEGTFPPAAFDP